MTVMTAEAETTPSSPDTPEGVFPLAHARPFTVDDLEAMPDDGRRHELIDGVLYVSPAPATRHQFLSVQLTCVLNAARPDDLIVMSAPYSVRLSDMTEVQPDLLVGHDEDFTAKLLPTPPVLVVEIISPSSALIDMNSKKALYERHGVPHYWVIDPEQPSLIVFELDDQGTYQEIAVVKGDEPFEATPPVPGADRAHRSDGQTHPLKDQCGDLTEELLPTTPLLAIEVLSPSTTHRDLGAKMTAYQDLGVADYWVIDSEQPSLTVFEFDDKGVYQEAAVVKGAEPFEATKPYPVRIVLTDLLGPLAD